jgi:hypothetical protein
LGSPFAGLGEQAEIGIGRRHGHNAIVIDPALPATRGQLRPKERAGLGLK